MSYFLGTRRPVIKTGSTDTLALLFGAGNAGAWFKAVNGLSVSGWPDRSGYNHDIAQVTAGSQPSISGVGAVFDGTDDMFTASHAASVSLVSATMLPDGASGSTAGRGFTGTGICRDGSDGTLWIANHGKAKASDPSFVSSIVNLNAAGTSIIREYTLASMSVPSPASVQGICDTGDGKIAFFHLGDNKIYEVNKDGTGCAANSAIGAISGGNGLSFDSILGHYILGVSSTMRWYNKSDGTLVQSRSSVDASGAGVAPDQLCFDAVQNWLWYSYDGTPGKIGAIDLNFAFAPHVCTLTLESFDAAEGVLVESNSILTANDRYYHGGSTPTDLNQLLRYTYVIPRYLSLGTRFQMGFIYRLPTQPSGSARCIFAFGDPLTATAEGGFGIWAPTGTNTTFRMFHRNSNRDLTITANSTRSVIFLDADLTNNAVSVWQNGTLIANTTFPSANTPATKAKRLVMGCRPSIAAGTVFVNAEILETFWMEGTAALSYRAAITAEMMARAA